MDPLAVARALLGIVISLIGLENAKAELTNNGARLANATADAIELAKWGKTSG